MEYKVSIIGFGHVGKAMKLIFDDWVTAIRDPMIEESASISQVNKTDVAFICVPTPMNKDGSCDVSIVEDVASQINPPLIIIKSTIEPGTTDNLRLKYKKNIVFSPEYFGESSYYIPPEWAPKGWPFHIFGGDKKDTAKCVEIFKPKFSPRTFYYQTDAKTAEIIKYMENVWGAMKVTFANEFYEACKYLGANFDEVREGWALDPRVEKMHTAVYENSRGFGGKCFPKDLMAFIRSCESAGYDPKLLKEIWNSNARFRGEKQEDF